MTKRFRHWIFWLTALFAFGFAVLHTQPAKRTVGRVLVQWMSSRTGGSAEIARVEYRIWRGELTLTDLRWEASTFRLTVREITATWGPFRGMEIRAHAPQLLLQRTAGTSPGPGPTPLIPSSLSKLAIREGEVLVTDIDDVSWLEISSVDVDVSSTESAQHTASLRSSHANVHAFGERRLSFGPIQADFIIGRETLTLKQLVVEKGASVVRGNGVASFAPVAMELELDYRLGRDVADPLAADIELTGALEGQARFNYDARGLHGETSFHSPRIASGLTGAWSVAGEMTLQDSVLEIPQLVAKGYEGILRVKGHIDLEQQHHILEASVSALDVEQWSQVWSENSLPVASVLNGQGHLTLRGSDLANVQGKAQLRLTPKPTDDRIPLSGDIAIEAEGGEVFVQTTDLSGPFGRASLHGRIHTQGPTDAHYEARIEDLRRLVPYLDTFNLPKILEETQGSVSLRGETAGSWREPPTLSSQWTVTSDKIGFRDASFALESRLRFKQHILHVEELIVRGARGHISSEGVIPLGVPKEPLQIRGSIDAFDLSPLAAIMQIPLRGTARGRFEVSGPLVDPNVDISLDFRPLVVEQTAGEGTLVARKRGRLLSVDRLEAAMGEGTASATGTYHLDTKQLEVELEAHEVRLSELVPPAQSNFWEGTATSIKAEVSGQFPQLRGRAELRLDDLKLHETELPSLVITARSDGQTANMECRSVESRLLASSTVGLEYPHRVESSVDLSALPLDQLLHSLFRSTPEDTRLRARGRLDITFPLARPQELRYRARIDQLVGRYRGVGGGTGSPFIIEGDRNSLRVDELDLVGTDTAIAVNGKIPLSTNSKFDLRLIGNARLELFNQFLETGELEGDASFDLDVGGSREEPEPSGELRIDEGAVTWRGIRGSNLTLVVDATGGKVLVEKFSGELLGGTFQLAGVSPLPYPSPERPARFDFEVEDVDLAELTTVEKGSTIQPLALVSANGTIEAASPEPSRLRGSGNLVTLMTSLGDIIIENDEPVYWSLAENQLTLERLHAVGGDTELDIDLAAERKDGKWMWRSSLQGAFDNVFLNPLIRSWDAAMWGTTRVNLRVEGTDAVPSFQGTGQLHAARLVIREPPLVLGDLSGKLQFANETMELSELKANVGGGTVEGFGEIALESFSELAGLDIQLKGNSVRLNYPEGMRSRIGGDLRLRGTSAAFLLSGDIRLEESSFERDISLESELLSSIDRQSFDLSEEASGADNVMLDVRAQSVNDIRIDNNLAQMQVRANLRISGTLEKPEMDGAANVRPDGTFRLGRNVYRIESGNILFRAYPSAPVELDVSARTEVSSVDILVRLRGPVDNVTMELSAPDHPNMSQGDIAALLVTGLTLADLSDLKTSTGQQQRIIGEQLASYLSGTFTSLVQRGLGDALPFDTISVAPSTLETDVSPEIRFSIGKAVTEDLFVTYSIGLENVHSQLWIVDYRLPKRLTFRATRKEDNEFAGRLSQQLEFDFPGRPSRADDAAPRAKVAELNVVGGPEPLENELLKKVKASPGNTFDYWKSQEDVERLTRFLKEQDYLNATVESRWTPTMENVGSLTYRIDAGTPIRIRWTGDDPGADIRRDVLNRWDGRFPMSFLLPDLTATTTERLMQERFFEAEVTASVEKDLDGIPIVIFDVQKGAKGRSLTLDFDGNQALTDHDLKGVLPSTSSQGFFALIRDPKRLEERIRLHYLSQGYVRAQIGPLQTDFLRTTGDFRVSVPIKEGPIAIVQEIVFEGADSVDRGKLMQELRLTPGRPFQMKAYSEDRSTITRVYRREGFPSTRVRGRLDVTESGIQIVYAIDEGQRKTIGNIRVVGNHVTKEETVRRELTFRENDPLRLSDLAETQQKLYELGVFRSVDIRTESKDDNASTTDVVVHLNEVPDVNFGYGLRYSTEDRLEVLTGIRFPSLFGSAHQAGLTFTMNADESIVRGSYSMPYFWRYELGTELFLSRETDENESLSEKVWSFTFQQHKKLLEHFAFQWSYTYQHSYLLGKVVTGPFPPEFTTRESILTTSFIEDRRDDFIQPSSGRFANVTFQVAPEALGSDVKFIKLFGRLSTFFSLRKDWIWAASYRLGIADAFDGFLLPANTFRAGGATTVRGFEQDSLGPPDPIYGSVIGGEGLVVFNQELRFPILKWLQGVAFYDAGNVFLKASEFRLFHLRHSAGAGLRLVLPFGLLRFDYAWVLDKEPGEQASRFWFNFNHAF